MLGVVFFYVILLGYSPVYMEIGLTYLLESFPFLACI